MDLRQSSNWSPSWEDVSLSLDNRSLCEDSESEKEMAARAVAFVVSRTRRGIVALCTDVASLMRAKRSLSERVAQLEHQISRRSASDSTLLTASSSGTRVSPSPSPSVLTTAPTSRSSVASASTLHQLPTITDEAPLLAVRVQKVSRDVQCDIGAEDVGPEKEKLSLAQEQVQALRKQIETLQMVSQARKLTIRYHLYVIDDHEICNPSSEPFSLPGPIFGCRCGPCDGGKGGRVGGQAVNGITAGHQHRVELGSHVLLLGERIGHIRYIGHLDEPSASKVKWTASSSLEFHPDNIHQSVTALQDKYDDANISNERIEKWAMNDQSGWNEVPLPQQTISCDENDDKTYSESTLTAECGVRQQLLKEGEENCNCNHDKSIDTNLIASIVNEANYIPSTDKTSNQVFVGVELEAPVGNCDGTRGGKRYFQCSPGYGDFLPLNHIISIIDSHHLNDLPHQSLPSPEAAKVESDAAKGHTQMPPQKIKVRLSKLMENVTTRK